MELLISSLAAAKEETESAICPILVRFCPVIFHTFCMLTSIQEASQKSSDSVDITISELEHMNGSIQNVWKITEVSSFSQLWISSIILADSSESSIIVVVRFSCAFDTSEAILAVELAAPLIFL